MGRHSLSDAEKKRRGTFRADQSEEAYAAKRGEKVVQGPWLTVIPEPEMPLNPAGRAKYDEITNLLFAQNKLTKVTCMDCEVLALHWQNVQARVAAGKAPSADSLKQISAITQRLRIAEDAPAIANPNEKSRFEGSGFANRRSTPFRLRPYSAAGKGEL